MVACVTRSNTFLHIFYIYDKRYINIIRFFEIGHYDKPISDDVAKNWWCGSNTTCFLNVHWWLFCHQHLTGKTDFGVKIIHNWSQANLYKTVQSLLICLLKLLTTLQNTTTLLYFFGEISFLRQEVFVLCTEIYT